MGALNLHGFLAKNQIDYGSEESIEFTDLFFRAVNYYSLLASNQIARERNHSFYDFNKSKYYTGEYFTPYIEEGDITIQSPKLKELFKNIHIPTKEDWENLANLVKQDGLYHSYRLAIAP